MAHDPLTDFERTTFEHDGTARDVFRLGAGPAVIVLAELPGITPKVAGFARRVADRGCTAVVPHLFGSPGRDPNAVGRVRATVQMLSTVVPLCISREFTVWATGRSSPVVGWLRALAVHEHDRCGGPGVGAVGMCFTGGFALAMAADPTVLAPVLSQPSLPLAVRRRQRASIDSSPAELAAVADRCRVGGLEVVGLRFTGDRLVPSERFDHLRRHLGDAFTAVELDDATANPHSDLPPHSVLTEHLVDEPGEPTRAALDTVLDFLQRRLVVA
jgi:dienelactone hydrolase